MFQIGLGGEILIDMCAWHVGQLFGGGQQWSLYMLLIGVKYYILADYKR